MLQVGEVKNPYLGLLGVRLIQLIALSPILVVIFALLIEWEVFGDPFYHISPLEIIESLGFTLIAIVSLRFSMLEVGLVYSKLAIYCKKERWDRAMLLIERKIVSRPKYFLPIWLTFKGDILMRKKEYQEALMIYNNITEKFPKYVNGWYSKACAECMLQRDDDALNSIKKVFELVKEDIKMSRKKRIKAIAYLTEAIKKEEALQCVFKIMEKRPDSLILDIKK